MRKNYFFLLKRLFKVLQYSTTVSKKKDLVRISRINTGMSNSIIVPKVNVRSTIPSAPVAAADGRESGALVFSRIVEDSFCLSTDNSFFKAVVLLFRYSSFVSSGT